MTKIFAYLGKHTLGDFLTEALYVCAVRELFDAAELTVCYVDNRPHKADIVNCIWNAKTVIKKEFVEGLLPVQAFEAQARNLLDLDPELRASGGLDADLILTGAMFQEAYLNGLPLPALRYPEHKTEIGDQALIDLGLEPDRWIATVYWKEPGYRYRGSMPVREISDATPYIGAIRHIIENLGGQVVRIGHRTDMVLPEIPGLVDLAKVDNSHWLQMYAVSVSRFMLASASGPSAYGPAFGVPTVLTDHVEVTGVWRSHDYILTRGMIRDGREYRQKDAYDAGMLEGYRHWKQLERPMGYRWNTAEELVEAADEMFHSTRSCLGWRAPMAGDVTLPRPNVFKIPQPQRRPVELLIPPRQRATLAASP